jgi:hypothetical protein
MTTSSTEPDALVLVIMLAVHYGRLTSAITARHTDVSYATVEGKRRVSFFVDRKNFVAMVKTFDDDMFMEELWT